MIAKRRGWWLLVGAGLAAWMLTIGAGLTMLWAYAETPGAPATANATWPAGASFTRDARGPTLVLFLHPQCPCSRASIAELARMLADTKSPVTTYALFYRPADAVAGWERTDLWDSAAAIPGVRVMSDERGAQAHVFGALVSGETMLYGATGSLLFSGGITGARGHEGDNPSRTALASRLAGHRTDTIRTAVFGCYLHAEADLLPKSSPKPERP